MPSLQEKIYDNAFTGKWFETGPFLMDTFGGNAHAFIKKPFSIDYNVQYQELDGLLNVVLHRFLLQNLARLNATLPAFNADGLFLKVIKVIIDLTNLQNLQIASEHLTTLLNRRLSLDEQQKIFLELNESLINPMQQMIIAKLESLNVPDNSRHVEQHEREALEREQFVVATPREGTVQASVAVASQSIFANRGSSSSAGSSNVESFIQAPGGPKA